MPAVRKYWASALTAFEALVNNAGQVRNKHGVTMAFGTSNANIGAARCSNRCGFFGFNFFSFSAAAKAEGAGF